MTAWARLAVDYQDDPKIAAAGPLAELLYLRGIAHSKGRLDDGFIASAVLPRLAFGIPADPEELAATLVRVGLWITVDDGYSVPPPTWEKWQETREKVERDRSASRARASRSRHARVTRDNGATRAPDTDTDTDGDADTAAAARGSAEHRSAVVAAAASLVAQRQGLPELARTKNHPERWLEGAVRRIAAEELADAHAHFEGRPGLSAEELADLYQPEIVESRPQRREGPCDLCGLRWDDPDHKRRHYEANADLPALDLDEVGS